MKIAFFTNFINHHQVPLADELYKLIGDDYKFVSFEPLPEEFIRRGYPDFTDRPYHIKGYLPENQDVVKEIATNSDVLLHSASPEKWISYRMNLNKLTIRYGERLIKLVDSRLLKPEYWRNLKELHTKYREKPLYMLGASGYNRFDSSLIGAYPKKVFRWGYFPRVENIDISEILRKKKSDTIRILWVGTIIDVKRPDLVPELAKRLKRRGYKFHIDMIGSGAREKEVLALMSNYNVSDCISLLGNIPNDEVLRKMRSSNIFIFTSYYGEGWGAVVNEAMANGCSVVCSQAVGAAPFLIESGYNGLTFTSGSAKDLYKKVSRFLEDKRLREQCAINAYHTVHDIWSPENAAHNFLKLCEDLIQGRSTSIESGPCSIAPLIYPNLNPFPFIKKIIRRIFTGKSLASI